MFVISDTILRMTPICGIFNKIIRRENRSDTDYGTCEISLTELLNFNEKAVNFRFVMTDTALEIYVNGELFRSIPFSDMT